MTKTLSWGVKPPDQVKQGLVIEPAPTVELRTGPDQVLDLGQGNVTIRREDGGPLGGTLSQPLVGGIATFDDLTIPDPGPRKLIAEVDTSSLIYPGLSGDGAVLLYRFKDQPEGAPEAIPDVGGVPWPISPPDYFRLTGTSVLATEHGGVSILALRDLQGQVPGLDEAMQSEAVIRFWYRTVLGANTGPSVHILGTADNSILRLFYITNSYDKGRNTEYPVSASLNGASVPGIPGDSGLPRGEPYVIAVHLRRVGSSTEVRWYWNGSLYGSGVSSSVITSPVNRINLWRNAGGTGSGQEFFEFGIFAGPTTPEKEMTEALRCGVVR